MEKKLLKENDYMTSRWSGGNTRELAIYPEDSKYLDRNFIWRLSSADSDLEESSFTKLQDFDRILMVLEGNVVLAHGETNTVSLGAYESDEFDGAVKTKCFGKLIKDYNLIMKKGCAGRMEAFECSNEAVKVGVSGISEDCCASYGFFVNDGYAVVNVKSRSGDAVQEMVRADQQLVINCDPGESIDVSIMGEGHCIFTEVIYDKTEYLEPEVDFASAEGSSNLKEARRLYFKRNRWSQAISRQKERTYMLPELEKALKKLDKFYVTFAAWVIEILIVLGLYTLGLGMVAAIIIALVVTALHIFLIAPLIYVAFLPKPIRAYIKDMDELTPYERKLFDIQINDNPQLERLERKYNKSGDDYFGDTNSPLAKLIKKQDDDK